MEESHDTPEGIPCAQELRRYGHVLGVLTRYGFKDILHRLSASNNVPWREKNVKGNVPFKRLSTARRVALAIEERGPTYIKFGQILSARLLKTLPSDVWEILARSSRTK
jgi:predicted unusual protein kinase regulating ubiquinone biosynthesis (AarF/ABC1/UbiB family)